MASRYWVGGNANWDGTAGTKWATTSGGAGGAAVPTSSDDVFFDANSGSITVTVSSVTANGLSLNFTGFTGTLNGSAGINIAGSVTLSNSMNITYNGILSITANGTLTSNGKTWSSSFTTNNSGTTITFADNWTNTGIFTNSAANSVLNGNTLFLSNNIVMGQNMSGTTNIEHNGTGIWSGAGAIKNNFTIKSTTNLTVISTVAYNTGTLTIETGANVILDGSTMSVAATATTTFNVNNTKFWNFIIGGSGASNTVQLNSDLYVRNICRIGQDGNTNTINGSNIYVENILDGNVSNTGLNNGTSSIYMVGLDSKILGGNGNAFDLTRTWGLPIYINTDGKCGFFGQLRFSNRLEVLKGKVYAKPMLSDTSSTRIYKKSELQLSSSMTAIGLKACAFDLVTITGGITVTMDEFFQGSANNITQVSSTNTTNYNITFLNPNKEKISKFTIIKNATFTDRNRLLALYSKANGGGNIGLRYYNNTPNDYAKNFPTVNENMTYGFNGFLLGDPMLK